jgi:L-ascorbate metabolism protein UlaG (beta-lactamase superfamily)
MGVLGVWAGCSNHLGARAIRGVVSEAGRGVGKPEHIPLPHTWDQNAITAAWLGHSTVLVNFYGVNILTDPVLCKRVGASTVFGNLGPKRLVAPALRPAELPPIDLVLISHAHMDHLDHATLRSLPGKPRAVSAHDTLDLLKHRQLANPISLAWGDRARVKTPRGEVLVTAFEVKHWGARWRYDSYRGYNGYILEREGRKILFGGDTAMTKSFRDLRGKGPFDFAIMPIGAYDPWVCSHCTPEEAVRMANDAGAARLLPVHFKTFPFGREGVAEPIRRLEQAIETERIGWRQVGETCRLA